MKSRLPDISDTDKMALIGRQTVLRKARRERVQEMRDVIVPILNDYSSAGVDWNLPRLTVLIDEIRQISAALDSLC